ncbi:GNAT family N-acetyltransferase [Castellaniella caeni]
MASERSLNASVAALARAASHAVPGCWLEVHDAFEPLQAAWAALVDQCDCYVFQTWQWNIAWQRAVGERQGVRPRLVRVLDGAGGTVALWPLCLYRQGRLRVLGFAGDRVSDYRAPLLSPAWLGQVDAAAFARLWDECLALIAGVDIVRLERMPERFAHTENPMARLPGVEHTENAHFVTLPATCEAYLRGRSAQILAGNRRKARRLKELGAFVFTPDHAASDWDAAFSALVAHKSRRWRETGSRDLFAEAGYLDFYRSLSAHHIGSGLVTLDSIRVADDFVAVHWGLMFRGRYYWILPAYASGAWDKYSCGRILLQYMIEWAIARNMQCFDLTVGDEPYKQTWSTGRLRLYRWHRARTWRGRLALAAGRLRERARAVSCLRRWVGGARRIAARYLR